MTYIWPLNSHAIDGQMGPWMNFVENDSINSDVIDANYEVQIQEIFDEIIPKATEVCTQYFVEDSDLDLEQIPLENQHNGNVNNPNDGLSSQNGKTTRIHEFLKLPKIRTYR